MPIPKPKDTGKGLNLVVKATRDGEPDVRAKELVPLVKLERVYPVAELMQGGGLANLTDEQRQAIARAVKES